MTFKKDYINYVLYTVVNNSSGEFSNNARLRSLVDKITSVDDVVKITFLVGKTAGLEFLFKYLLYISDKIDKSQISIFNLKDNFDYDIKNLTKICRAIENYKSAASSKKIESIPESTPIDEAKEKDGVKEPGAEIQDTIKQETVKIDKEQEPSNLINMEDIESLNEEAAANEPGKSNLTLIENPGSYTEEADVFELSEIDNAGGQEETEEETEEELEEEVTVEAEKEITEDVNAGDKQSANKETEEVFELDELQEELQEELQNEDANKSANESENVQQEIIVTGNTDDIIEEVEIITGQEAEKDEEKETEQLEEIEILVNKPVMEDEYTEEEYAESGTPSKGESVTNEAYYKFETKFFEEVKILEKLFSTVENDCKVDEKGKLIEKCLQSLTEIIEITSELSNLSRQLSFDLIADIFLTMNLYFTKSISAPAILTGERIRLLDSALALVNSLIKGEDYLNYDAIVDRIERLKEDITRTPEEQYENKEEVIPVTAVEQEAVDKTDGEYREAEAETEKSYEQAGEPAKTANIDSANFKMKYLVKEFEKSFQLISDLKGEYSRFDALEKVDELNNALRLIAKISAAVKMRDALKLAEVSYVFLKYVKDYRMDLLDPEIQQIIKYIIFTFKMLLTNRKPEDFNVLVQHLNDPVKIFTDS